VAAILEDSSPSKTIHVYSSDSFLISHPHTYILLSTNLLFLRGSCVVISLENDLGIQNSTPARFVVSTFAAKLGASWIGTDTNLLILFDFCFLDYYGDFGWWVVVVWVVRILVVYVAGGVLEIGRRGRC
jgi:hypothetical protein